MRVLFIAEIASAHSARWIDLLSGAEIESAIFQATCGPTEMFEELRQYSGVIYTPKPIPGISRQASLFDSDNDFERLIGSEKIYPDRYSEFLRETIQEFQPDLIHVLGLCVNFRNSTRCLVRAFQDLDVKPKIAYSSWGADLDYFPNAVPSESEHIAKFLRIADYHITECERDARLARELGFNGVTLAKLPANGGIAECITQRELDAEANSRDIILIKGRDEADGDPIGRAMRILDACELSSDVLMKFKIRIFQATHGVNINRRAKELRDKTGLDVEVLPYLSSAELYKLMRQSYLFIANTINDGLPLSLVEAMAFGAYPIHSDLESIRDYIVDSENGSLVSWNDTQQIAEAIRAAIRQPSKTAIARSRNLRFVQKHLLRKIVRRRMLGAYRRIAGGLADFARRSRVFQRKRREQTETLKLKSYKIARSGFHLLPTPAQAVVRRIISGISR